MLKICISVSSETETKCTKSYSDNKLYSCSAKTEMCPSQQDNHYNVSFWKKYWNNINKV